MLHFQFYFNMFTNTVIAYYPGVNRQWFHRWKKIWKRIYRCITQALCFVFLLHSILFIKFLQNVVPYSPPFLDVIMIQGTLKSSIFYSITVHPSQEVSDISYLSTTSVVGALHSSGWVINDVWVLLGERFETIRIKREIIEGNQSMQFG